jgi:hypothetical protein
VPQHNPYLRTAGLIAPLNTHRDLKPSRSSTSIAPESIPNNRQTLGSLASSQAIPSSWQFEPAEPEIFGADLDAEWDEGNRFSLQTVGILGRSASVSKKSKSAMYTISKHNLASSDSILSMLPPPLAILRSNSDSRDSVVVFYLQDASRRGSASALLSESAKSVDYEKSHIAQQSISYQQDEELDMEYIEKEPEALPRYISTTSKKRSNGRKPLPDIGAVRDTGPRISLASLTSLIRRAVKMATIPRMAPNPDNTRANSRIDLIGKCTQADSPAAMDNCHFLFLFAIV